MPEIIFADILWFRPKTNKPKPVDLITFLVNNSSAKAVVGLATSCQRKNDNHFVKQVWLTPNAFLYILTSSLFFYSFPSLASCSAPVLVISRNLRLSFCVLSGLRRSTMLPSFKMNYKAFSLGGHKNVSSKHSDACMDIHV